MTDWARSSSCVPIWWFRSRRTCPRLAARAQGRVSVARALDGLDQFTLEVLDGLRYVRADDGHGGGRHPADPDRRGRGGPRPRCGPRSTSCAARFLVFGPDAALHLVTAVDELTSPYPAGLGRPAAELDNDGGRARRRRGRAAPHAAERTARGPGRAGPAGRRATGRARCSRATSRPTRRRPVRWLLDHHLLVPVADDMVELPREVGIVLRRDTGPLGHAAPGAARARRARSGPEPTRPARARPWRRSGTSTPCCTRSPTTPAPVLRSFGLGVRDLRRLARDAGISEGDAALLLEIAYAAGLLTYTEPGSRGTGGRAAGQPRCSGCRRRRYDTWRGASWPAGGRCSPGPGWT